MGALVSPPAMSRRSLRPQLNQIRGWVRQGRTDAWIAHQLEVTVQQIQSFKRENELEADGESAGAPEEVDLRAEDDAAIAAELEAEEARRAEEEAKLAEEAAKRAADEDERGRREEARAPARAPAAAAAAASAPGRSRAPSTTARRATACGSTPRSRTIPSTPSTGPGHRPVEVTIEEDQIVIKRAGGGDEDDDD